MQTIPLTRVYDLFLFIIPNNGIFYFIYLCVTIESISHTYILFKDIVTPVDIKFLFFGFIVNALSVLKY